MDDFVIELDLLRAIVHKQRNTHRRQGHFLGLQRVLKCGNAFAEKPTRGALMEMKKWSVQCAGKLCGLIAHGHFLNYSLCAFTHLARLMGRAEGCRGVEEPCDLEVGEVIERDDEIGEVIERDAEIGEIIERDSEIGEVLDAEIGEIIERDYEIGEVIDAKTDEVSPREALELGELGEFLQPDTEIIPQDTSSEFVQDEAKSIPEKPRERRKRRAKTSKREEMRAKRARIEESESSTRPPSEESSPSQQRCPRKRHCRPRRKQKLLRLRAFAAARRKLVKKNKKR